MPPIPQAYAITRPEEVIEHLAYIIESSTLEFAYIAKYDEELIPGYPAVRISPGTVDKIPHGTHTFEIVLRAFLYVMHADLTISKRTRSLEDLLLATELVNLLEADMSFGGQIIHGFVESETPAAFPPRNPRGSAVVGTRLLWSGITQRRFK